MFNLPEGEGGTSKAVWNPATLGDTAMEMGADHHGFLMTCNDVMFFYAFSYKKFIISA